MSNTIIVNGKKYAARPGSAITIVGNNVYVDGMLAESGLSGVVEIRWQGAGLGNKGAATDLLAIDTAHDIISEMNYSITLRFSEEDEAWVAEVPDLPGCMADGPTETEAIAAAHEAIRLWIQVAKEEGRLIPQPYRAVEPASGKFLVRMPTSLHRHLQRLAKNENVSLNQLVISLLSAAAASHLK